MPLKEQDYVLIEKQLLNSLTASEQSIVEERLNDPDFKKELDLQMDLKVAFKTEGRAHLKNQLQGFEQRIPDSNIQAPEVNRRFSIGRILTIAASLAFFIFTIFWFSNRKPSEYQLYAQYFSPYPNVVAPINKSVEKTDRRGEAFRAYELKNYQEALSLMTKLNTQDDAVKLYKGICELILENPQKAIQHFDSMRRDSGPFYVPMNWYKALTLLKLNRVSEAKIHLEIVVQNAQTQAMLNQATELLAALSDH